MKLFSATFLFCAPSAALQPIARQGTAHDGTCSLLVRGAPLGVGWCHSSMECARWAAFNTFQSAPLDAPLCQQRVALAGFAARRLWGWGRGRFPLHLDLAFARSALLLSAAVMARYARALCVGEVDWSGPCAQAALVRFPSQRCWAGSDAHAADTNLLVVLLCKAHSGNVLRVFGVPPLPGLLVSPGRRKAFGDVYSAKLAALSESSPLVAVKVTDIRAHGGDQGRADRLSMRLRGSVASSPSQPTHPRRQQPHALLSGHPLCAFSVGGERPGLLGRAGPLRLSISPLV